MAWLLTYDVADSKRLQRIHRCVQHHAMPLQYSVFWLHGSTQARDACLAEVLPLLRTDSDDLRAYALPDRGFRLRLGAPALPGGIVWSALPGEWWNSNLEAGEKDDDGS